MSAKSEDTNSTATDGAAAASRRKFLRDSVVMGGLASAGVIVSSAKADQPDGLPAIEPWSKTPGTPVGAHPYGRPSEFEKKVVRQIRPTDKQYLSSSSKSPIDELDGIITPNGLFYERHHGGVPNIDPREHRLMVHGLVDKPLVFSIDDIRRFPSVSRIHFLECSGNPGYDVHGKTAAEANGLVSCAEWTGVPVRTVLEEAGFDPKAKWVIAEGADAAGMTRSIPIEKCLDDALLVYSQNGERLRPEQGYPLRLLVPGFEGNMNVKWLRRLHVVVEPAYSREETSKYTDPLPDGTARKFTFYMEAKSIITSPSGGHRLAEPGFQEIRGIAWSGRGKIERVEVSVDDGKTWQEAALQQPVLTKAITRFRFPWTWTGESTVIQSRATDETGYVQPTLESLVSVRGLQNGYHNNAITPWRVLADGEVKNARI
jgi:sulfane dehydrogenase subunit SoxC